MTAFTFNAGPSNFNDAGSAAIDWIRFSKPGLGNSH